MTPPVRGRMPRKTKSSKTQKHEIVIDVANIDVVLNIIRTAYEAAERYVTEQKLGDRDYGPHYNDMKNLMQLIEGVLQTDSEEIKILYKKDGDLRCAHFEDFVNLQESIAGFGTTKEDAKKQLFKCHYLFLMGIK